ncbi:MAG: adenosylcobinamide-GDP ribazoletransferase [Candidatus Omnitrophica bacterium]|nr:adenosylcobinamide-GDP ribazoletransferase [Candidatus Omnitrophota bacterium]
MKKFLIALQFLTILPVKIRQNIKKEDYGKSLLYFPIIGLLIGLVLSLTLFLFDFLPDLVMGTVILIISIIITGGIHLDGFADTCDAFYGSKPKEEMLRIMRDSRIGVMGVLGLASLLLLKFSLIVSTPRDILWKSLIMMVVFARWSQVLACFTSDYARKEGKAKYFIAYNSKKEFFIGGFFTIALFLLLMKLNGFILFVLSLLPIFVFINYIKKKIGGMTGDTIGATSEIAEVVVLFLLLITQN